MELERKKSPSRLQTDGTTKRLTNIAHKVIIYQTNKHVNPPIINVYTHSKKLINYLKTGSHSPNELNTIMSILGQDVEIKPSDIRYRVITDMVDRGVFYVEGCENEKI